MFDDNIEEGRPGSYGSGTDSLSLKTACSVYLGKQKREKVPFRDDINRIKRPLEIGDIVQIRYVFESVIKTYYEHMFLYKNDKFHSEKLFPNLSFEQLNEHFNIQYPMPSKFQDHFFHFGFVELTPNTELP